MCLLPVFVRGGGATATMIFTVIFRAVGLLDKSSATSMNEQKTSNNIVRELYHQSIIKSCQKTNNSRILLYSYCLSVCVCV